MAEKKSSMIRVNNSMFVDTKNPNVKGVRVGLMHEDGSKETGVVFMGTKAIHPDKNTEALPSNQQKSFVAFQHDTTYNFTKRGEKQDDGTFKNETVQMSGKDIVDMNKAYMKDRTEQRTKNLESAVEQTGPEAEQQAEA